MNIPYRALINSTGGLRLLGQIGKAVCHAHGTHKAMKRRVMKVPTGPLMHPSCETVSKTYTILLKRFSFVNFWLQYPFLRNFGKQSL